MGLKWRGVNVTVSGITMENRNKKPVAMVIVRWTITWGEHSLCLITNHAKCGLLLSCNDWVYEYTLFSGRNVLLRNTKKYNFAALYQTLEPCFNMGFVVLSMTQLTHSTSTRGSARSFYAQTKKRTHAWDRVYGDFFDGGSVHTCALAYDMHVGNFKKVYIYEKHTAKQEQSEIKGTSG